METTRDLLAAQPFLAGLTDWQLGQLARVAQRSMFHSGNRVFREGDHGDGCWLITQGQVNVDTRLSGRGDVVVDTLGPGAVLGLSWLFPPYRWNLGAIAVATTVTVELVAAQLRGLCERDPALGYELTCRFIEVVVGRMQATPWH